MINWQYYPKSNKTTPILDDVVKVFQKNAESINSHTHEKQESNKVLAKIRQDLEKIGFKVEKNKKKEGKIKVPVLFGRNGKLEKYFDADALHEESGTVLEVEAGRGFLNNQFLKDLFQACLMHNIDYLVIAVRNVYLKRSDYESVEDYFNALYASGRLKLPLKGVLIIGY